MQTAHENELLNERINKMTFESDEKKKRQQRVFRYIYIATKKYGN